MRRLTLAAAVVPLLLTACASDDASDTPATDAPTTDVVGADGVVSASVDTATPLIDGADTGRLVPLYAFEGYANTETGEFRIERVIPNEAGLRTVNQAMWCEAEVVQDGIEGSGPAETLELNTPDGSVARSLPGEPIPAQCQVPGADETLYPILGVFCAEVSVQSFFTTPLDDVYISVTEFAGIEADYGAYAAPRGTAAASPDGIDAPEDELGLWYYGDLTEAGGGGDSATQVWTFRNVANGSYAFAGQVYARYDEICDNDIDDDCDGIVDNRCETTPDGDACNYDEDCVSGLCADIDADTGEGTCAATCAEGRFGNPCADCPGGAGALQCTANGTCDDGAAGTGDCACDTGFTGDACDTCTADRVGDDCEICPGGIGNACSGNGTCSDVGGTPTCACDAVHTGADCSTCACANGGTCVGATCACPGNWGGATCTTCELACANGGTPNGSCTACTCPGNWTGPTCATCSLSCLNGGSPNGSCSACNCVGGYTGASCETPPAAVPAVGTRGSVGVVSGSQWQVCRADAGSAWITGTPGGRYQPRTICQSLGYGNYNAWGGTCGAICGYCGVAGNERYDGNGNCGDNCLTYTVHWRCVP